MIYDRVHVVHVPLSTCSLGFAAAAAALLTPRCHPAAGRDGGCLLSILSLSLLRSGLARLVGVQRQPCPPPAPVQATVTPIDLLANLNP